MKTSTALWASSIAGILGIAGLLVGADSKTEPRGTDPLAGMAQPEYDAAGGLLRPEGYERWIFVGTSLGISYSEDEPKSGAGDFHNVYVQPEAYDYFKERGEFPEKTIFVMTNSPASKKEGNDLINRHGHFAGKTRGLEVSVKDSARFEDGWAYYIYRAASGPRGAAKPFPRAVCWDCHAEHAQDDNVFTQFYAVLDAARPKPKLPK